MNNYLLCFYFKDEVNALKMTSNACSNNDFTNADSCKSDIIQGIKSLFVDCNIATDANEKERCIQNDVKKSNSIKTPNTVELTDESIQTIKECIGFNYNRSHGNDILGSAINVSSQIFI